MDFKKGSDNGEVVCHKTNMDTMIWSTISKYYYVDNWLLWIPYGTKIRFQSKIWKKTLIFFLALDFLYKIII